MTLTSRYTHRYVAFIDALYIVELCDTEDREEFEAICEEYKDENGFTAYIDDEEISL